MNTRSRAFTITLNYFTEEDLEEMSNMLTKSNPSYFIYGFEGIEPESEVHPHIHLYVHYANAKTVKRIMKYFTKKHHIETVQDPSAMITYCKGYQNGLLKEPEIGENDWFSEGIPVANGVCTSSQKVVNSIKEGKTLSELYTLYPSFMMFHSKKVHEFIKDTSIKKETKIIKLCIIPGHMRYNYGKDSFLYEPTIELEVYDGQSILITHAYINPSIILRLCNGVPYTFRRGYELIDLSPRKIYFYYETKKELDYLLKQYSDFVHPDNVINQYDPHSKSELSSDSFIDSVSPGHKSFNITESDLINVEDESYEEIVDENGRTWINGKTYINKKWLTEDQLCNLMWY